LSDRIELRGLRVTATCGVLPEEKARRQPFEVDMDVHADLGAASLSDDLADTVDYGALCALVAGIADTRPSTCWSGSPVGWPKTSWPFPGSMR